MAIASYDIAGELKVRRDDGAIWHAFVVRDPASEELKLYMRVDDAAPVFAGSFGTAATVVSVIESHIKSVFPGKRPLVNTLAKLSLRGVESLVPSCFESFGSPDRDRQCAKCPYAITCENPKPKQIIPYVEAEPDQLLAERIRKKVAKRYG